MRIKKGDIVAVTTGKSKPIHGKYNTGEVLKAAGDRVIVKGINIVTKHNRPSQANPDGGITHREAPIHISNIAYLDPVTKKPTRIEYQFVDGKKVRVTKDSGTVIDK